MALKTIIGYPDIDFKFDPIENADYSENNVKQDYSVITNALAKANKSLSSFLDVAKDVNAGLSQIGTTGISSSELTDSYNNINKSLSDAEFQVEVNNKTFANLVQEQLDEIAANIKASQATLASSNRYGEYQQNAKSYMDHSKKAADYAKQFLMDSTIGAAVSPVGGTINAVKDAVGYAKERAQQAGAAGNIAQQGVKDGVQAVKTANEKAGDYVYEHVTEPVANGVKKGVEAVKTWNEKVGDAVYDKVTQPALDGAKAYGYGIAGAAKGAVQGVKDFVGDIRQGVQENVQNGTYAGK